MEQTFLLKKDVHVSMARIRIKDLKEYNKCNYRIVTSLSSTFPGIPSRWFLKVFTKPLLQSPFQTALTVKIPYELTIVNLDPAMDCKRFFKVEMMFDDTKKGNLQEAFNFKLTKTCHGASFTEIDQVLKLRGVFNFQKDSYIKGGDFVLCVRVIANDVAEFLAI